MTQRWVGGSTWTVFGGAFCSTFAVGCGGLVGVSDDAGGRVGASGMRGLTTVGATGRAGSTSLMSSSSSISGTSGASSTGTYRSDGSGTGSGSSDGFVAATTGAATSSESGSSSGCTPGTQRCLDSAHVETCDSSGQWGNVWLCSTGTCSGGACSDTATTAEPPSCAPGGAGMTDCGPGGDGTESCCTSLAVPGGTYYRTYTNSGTSPAGEADPATVSGFRLDKYLVTVGRFRQFVAAWNNGTGYLPPAGSGKHTHLNGGQGLVDSAPPGGNEAGWMTAWDGAVDPTDTNLSSPWNGGGCFEHDDATWTSTAGANESLPINCANWFEDYAFCIWDGGFLPSEAEWEYAAAGGNEQREYPWGQTDPGTASQYAVYNSYYTGNAMGIAPVGFASQGAARWGQLDMAGELAEWSLDCNIVPYPEPCTDCAYLGTPEDSGQDLGGGSFEGEAGALLASVQDNITLSDRFDFIGFRCARTP